MLRTAFGQYSPSTIIIMQVTKIVIVITAIKFQLFLYYGMKYMTRCDDNTRQLTIQTDYPLYDISMMKSTCGRRPGLLQVRSFPSDCADFNKSQTVTCDPHIGLSRSKVKVRKKTLQIQSSFTTSHI